MLASQTLTRLPMGYSSSPQLRKEAADTLHIVAVLSAEAVDQISFFRLRAQSQKCEHNRRRNGQQPGSQRQPKAHARYKNSYIHRVSHKPVWASINEMRVSARDDCVSEVPAQTVKHPDQPSDSTGETRNADP